MICFDVLNIAQEANLVKQMRGVASDEAEAHTDARPAADINRHPWRALAEEGAGGVDALPIDAHPRKHLTLIHICQSGNRATLSLSQPQHV